MYIEDAYITLKSSDRELDLAIETGSNSILDTIQLLFDTNEKQLLNPILETTNIAGKYTLPRWK